MARTVIDLDDVSLRAAMKVLGTTTKVATVNRALAEVAGRPARLRFLDDLDVAAADLADPDVMRGAVALNVYLADKSALEQRRHSNPARDLLALLLGEGSLASCHVIAMEVLYSARNRADYERLQEDLDELPWLPITEEVMDRALDVQHLLAGRGQHRLPLPDLMIAATAELNDAVVLHYDHDYDLIADITGQPTQWILERGTGG